MYIFLAGAGRVKTVCARSMVFPGIDVRFFTKWDTGYPGKLNLGLKGTMLP